LLDSGPYPPASPVDELIKVAPMELRLVDSLVVEGGGITPPPPLLLLVYVEPDVVYCASLEMTIVLTIADGVGTGGRIPALPVEENAKVLPETVKLPTTGVPVGGAVPSPPVAVCVAKENHVVTSPLLSVVTAGTKVGGLISPPPLVKTDVEVPHMSFVVAPLIIVVVVTSTEVIGCETIVRVTRAVHSQEVTYTARQKLEDAETTYQLQCL